MCDNLNGPNAPFCSPSTNTAVQVGRTLEKKVTWDRRFFNRTSSSSSVVFIQADFGSTAVDSSFGGLDGFTSPPLDPQSGRFTWTILDSFLTSGGSGTTSRGSRIFLAQESTQIDPDTGLSSTTVRRITGPRVVIRARDGNGAAIGSGAGQPNPLSIALPVGLGALVVLVIGVFFCVRRWRNRDGRRGRDVEMKGGVDNASGRGGFLGRVFGAGGYGIGKSRSQRVGGGGGGGSRNGWGGRKWKRGKGEDGDIEIVHSTHMNAVGQGGPVRMGFMGVSGSTGGGGNVFRDEVRRQDRGRGRDYL